MDNEKWTHEVKNNDLADGLEDCKIFENTLDNNLDKKTEENKNDLPKTGQGVFYGVTIAVAVIVIGSGVYLVTKKKK